MAKLTDEWVDRFLFMHTDGKDICHVGNGPNGPANAAYLEAVQPKNNLAFIAQIDQLQSELTTLKAQVDGAWEAGRDAASEAADSEWFSGDRHRYASQLGPAICQRINNLTRTTKPTEAKDGSK